MGTCKVKVSDGGRFISSHTCGRKLSGSDDYPELCGVHAAAKRRKAQKEADRLAITERRAAETAEFRTRVDALNERYGLKAISRTLTPTTGPGAFVSRPTGDVILSLDQLESLLAKLDCR